jgi:hypothetical protein
VQHELEKLLGLPAGDTSAAEVAKSLSALGALAADSGAQYSSIGLFRSPTICNARSAWCSPQAG